MRPCTLNAALVTRSSIVLGRRYFSASTIRRAIYGLIHAFVMGVALTDVVYGPEPQSILRQIMALWYRWLVLEKKFEGALPESILGEKTDYRCRDISSCP